MNKLIVLSGVPGSGKSYFSALLRLQKKTHVYVISSDGLRREILGNQRNLSEDELIWRIFYALTKAFSEDKNGIVILDATNAKKEYRLNNIKPFKKLYDQIDLVCFKLDRDIVIRQNRERDNPIPDEPLYKLIDEFELPDEEEKAFFDHVDIIRDQNLSEIIKRYL